MKDDEIKDKNTEPEIRVQGGKGKEWNSSSPLMLIYILCVAALIIAGIVFGIKRMAIPAAACAGGFVLAVILLFVYLAIMEKVKLKRAESIVGKPGTRKVTATVIKSELFSRKTIGERNNYPGGLNGITVSAIYKITLKDGVLEYVALSSNRYKDGDEVEVYINENVAYIDETPQSDLTNNTPQETKHD